ncbi:MAG: insulinase family protein [Oscillospiraceae bacterium]|nr:insulinase family protein [Oscillospiraceae bacterium]
MEMDGFTGTSAMFGTKYGSVNTTFKTVNDDDFITVPEGVAHFLEHKLFENEDCDVFKLFAKTGAHDNAYTSFDSTVCYFDCTDNFTQSLEILLDFVQKPYFTQETVDKEQGIIGQEIRMCEDNPYRRVYFNLLSAVYKNHPVKIEIAGTVDSISKIDADLLYRCYNTFYNLNNMVLAVAGNCRVNEVLAVCDKMLKPSRNIDLECISPDEPEEVASKMITQKMSVGIPLFAFGFKASPSNGRQRLKDEYISSFLLSLVFGQTSRFYQENSASGLINSSLESETLDGDGYFVNILTGESRDPERLKELVIREIQKVLNTGIDEAEFEMLKRSRYGSIIKSFNSVSGCCSRLLETHIGGCGPFDSVDVLASLTALDINEGIKKLLDPNRMAVSIIYP